MQSSFDKEADALYIRLLEGDFQSRVVRVTDDIWLDFGAGEQLVGIEAPGASHLFKDLQEKSSITTSRWLAQFDDADAMRM